MKVNSKKTNFGVINSDSTPMDITDTELLSKYGSEVIEFARKLKGSHEKGNETGTQYFTDKYYCEYAQRYIANQKQAQSNAHISLSLSSMLNTIPDSEWSMYSYEEIIAMADNGVNVPKNVLGWAKGQQESDVTAYFIISDNAENDDNSSTAEVSGESDIGQLRAQAQSYVTRANKQQKKAVEETQRFEQSVEDAKTQKYEYENNIKNSVQTAKNISKEYKSLEEKKASGTITQTEISRLNQLKGQIGTQSNEGKRLQQEGAKLDDFLDSIDTFNETQELAVKLSKEAKDAGMNLGQLNKTYNENDITHAINNFQMFSIGTLENLMSGISTDKISDITIIKAKDFEKIGEDVSKVIQANKESDVATFALNKKSSTPENNTIPTEENLGTTHASSTLIKSNPKGAQSAQANDAYANYNKSGSSKAADKQADEDSKDLDNVKSEANYGPSLEGAAKTASTVTTATGGLAALATNAFMSFQTMETTLIPTNVINTALTLTSIANLEVNKSNVKKTKNILQKNEKTLDKEMKNLEKEHDKIIKEHEANIALGEMLYNQAQELDKQTKNYILEFMTKSEENQTNTQNKSQEEQDKHEQGEQTTMIEDPNAGQRASLSGQMDKLAEADAKVFEKSKTPLKRVQKAETTAAKSVTSLYNQNQKLEKANKDNKSTSTLTAGMGAISLVAGAYGLLKGKALISLGFSEIQQGTILMGYTYTYSAGVALQTLGFKDHLKGVKGVATSVLTLISGGIAGVTGAAGLVLTNQIKSNIKDNSKTAKTEGKNIQKQRKLYLKIKKAMAKSKQAKVPQIAAESPDIAQAQAALSSSSGGNSSSSQGANNNTQQQSTISANNMQSKTSGISNTQKTNTAETLTSPAAKKTAAQSSKQTTPTQTPAQNNTQQTGTTTTPATNKKTTNSAQNKNKEQTNKTGVSKTTQNKISQKTNNSTTSPKATQTKNKKQSTNLQNTPVSGNKANKNTKNQTIRNNIVKDTPSQQKLETKNTPENKDKNNVSNNKTEPQIIDSKSTSDKKSVTKNNPATNSKPKPDKNDKTNTDLKNNKPADKTLHTLEEKADKEAQPNNAIPYADGERVDRGANSSEYLKQNNPLKPQSKDKQPSDKTQLPPEKPPVNNTDKQPKPEKPPVKDTEKRPKPEQSPVNDTENQSTPDNAPTNLSSQSQKTSQRTPAATKSLSNNKVEEIPFDDDKNKIIDKTEDKSDVEKDLLKNKNKKVQNNVEQPKDKDEYKQSLKETQVKNVEVKPTEEQKKPYEKSTNLKQPQKMNEPEIIPVKDNDGKTVNLSPDKIQPHSNKKLEETKQKDEENLQKTKGEEPKKELSQNINDTNTEVLKEAIIAQIEAVVNKNDPFDNANPEDTNTIISGQIGTINSLKQRFASIDDRSEEISASATVHANPKDNVQTDDKADKKLTRFNNDSIIESKKKRKKIVAVSEAFGGKTKK